MELKNIEDALFAGTRRSIGIPDGIKVRGFDYAHRLRLLGLSSDAVAAAFTAHRNRIEEAHWSVYLQLDKDMLNAEHP